MSRSNRGRSILDAICSIVLCVARTRSNSLGFDSEPEAGPADLDVEFDEYRDMELSVPPLPLDNWVWDDEIRGFYRPDLDYSVVGDCDDLEKPLNMFWERTSLSHQWPDYIRGWCRGQGFESGSDFVEVGSAGSVDFVAPSSEIKKRDSDGQEVAINLQDLGQKKKSVVLTTLI